MFSEQQLQDTMQQRKKQEAISLKLSLGRLLTGILTIITLFVGYYMDKEYVYTITLVSIIAFIWLVHIHGQVLERIQYSKTKEYVLQRYLDRKSDAWMQFSEDGSVYIEETNGAIKDLDILGKHSLFQYINIATTSRGKRILANKLTRKTFDKGQIEKEQKALQELFQKEQFVMNYEIAGNRINKQKNSEQVLETFIARTKENLKYQSIGVFKYLIPLLTITCSILAIFQIALKVTIILVPICIFGQWISAILMLPKNSEIFLQVANLSSSFHSYQKLCKMIEEESFKDPYLCSLQKNICENKKASQAMKELAAISDAVKQRGNLVAFIVCNGFLLWDIHCRERFYAWMLKYGYELEIWLDTIGEFEALCSLQTLLHAKENICFPHIEETSRLSLSFKEASHPLLMETKAVPNTFTMKKNTCVITGSNMSGKTTFMRTIGLNLVLAYAGGPVMASQFTCSLMRIFTSMRIGDDVSRGISTFYGELLRIKEIVEVSKNQQPMIALIDEIFKGTNSKDRIIGAKETVKRLTKPYIFTFITTHDFELCELEHEVASNNYHFEEYYQGNKILFDYKIKEGRSKSTNAQYLLKMVGIIE